MTSSNQEAEQIIDYSNSEYIFRNFKNKDGSRLCQSNIGNLQSQLSKYDKAIYHLALSLEDVSLKKILSQALSDEFDESDILLHKLEMNYMKEIKGKEANILAKKQQKKGQNKKISQNFIEILINSRYNKLINFYYKFFSLIKKSKYNYEKLGGFFINTNFHTISNYHKVLIQYIYLCYVSNDLVKIGESILDYIEFLIKFKLKTSDENDDILNIYDKDILEIKSKQLNKKKYFDKIINWFNLFNNYAKHTNENSALSNFKDLCDSYIYSLQSNHNDLFSGNQSVLLFQVNLQRYDFLKGKFALACENHSDALGFTTFAAKKKRIIIDGLIKKRALKHIVKIAEKARKKIISKNYSKFNYYEIFEKIRNNNDIKSLKIKKDTKSFNSFEEKEENIEVNKNNIKLIDKIKELIDIIKDDINETNEKQLKDVIILIDCNVPTKLILDSYIDVVETIIKNYLSNDDRFGVFFLENEQRIISPIAKKNKIDLITLSKDLDNISDNLFKKEKIELSSLNEIIPEKEKEELYSEKNSEEESFNAEGFTVNNGYLNNKEISIEEMVKSLNYCLTYLKMKEITTNENYFIYFNSNMKALMDYLNQNNLGENNKKKKIKSRKETKVNFLLVGKFDKDNEKLYNDILRQYYGLKSEVIPFDNMKKMKSILSSNNIINDNINFPNEIYKG